MSSCSSVFLRSVAPTDEKELIPTVFWILPREWFARRMSRRFSSRLISASIRVHLRLESLFVFIRGFPLAFTPVDGPHRTPSSAAQP